MAEMFFDGFIWVYDQVDVLNIVVGATKIVMAFPLGFSILFMLVQVNITIHHELTKCISQTFFSKKFQHWVEKMEKLT